jgi:Carbohydrate esterase, sialic acid-specific acetylesterase/Concanavalin A-like lectin/glucanases superfamily
MWKLLIVTILLINASFVLSWTISTCANNNLNHAPTAAGHFSSSSFSSSSSSSSSTSNFQSSSSFVPLNRSGTAAILFMGQSNCNGFTDGVDVTTDADIQTQFGPRTLYINYSNPGLLQISQQSVIVEALDILDWVPASQNGVSPAITFAYSWQQYYSQRVIIIPCCYEGTSITNYLNGTSAYAQCVALTRNAVTMLPNTTLECLYYDQGETDSQNGVSGATFQSELEELVGMVRTDLGIYSLTPEIPLPVVAVQMVPYWVSTIGGTAIQIQQVLTNLPFTLNRTGVIWGYDVRNNSLVHSQYAPPIHYSQASQQWNGMNGFSAYLAAGNNFPGSTTPGKIVQVFWNLLTATIMTLSWIPDPIASSYKIYMTDTLTNEVYTQTSVSPYTEISNPGINAQYNVQVSGIFQYEGLKSYVLPISYNVIIGSEVAFFPLTINLTDVINPQNSIVYTGSNSGFSSIGGRDALFISETAGNNAFSIPSAYSLSPSFTVSFWTNFIFHSGYPTLFLYTLTGIYGATPTGMHITYVANQGMILNIDNTNDNYPIAQSLPLVTTQTQQWNHVVVTFNSNTLLGMVYVNATQGCNHVQTSGCSGQSGFTTPSGAYPGSTNDLYLGGGVTSVAFGLNGYIQCLIIENIAWNTTQVTNAYNQQINTCVNVS